MATDQISIDENIMHFCDNIITSSITMGGIYRYLHLLINNPLSIYVEFELSAQLQLLAPPLPE